MVFNYIFIFSSLFLLLFLGWWLFFRKKKLSVRSFPLNWQQILNEKVLFYARLSETEKNRFEQTILQFLDDVTITGVETTIDDTDRLLVAASAVIPLFGFPGWQYRNLNEVLLYKGLFNDDYATEGNDRNTLGMVGTGAMQRMMILSKPALHLSFENQRSNRNVGIHEFVHLLDKADGSVDGIPEVLIQSQFTLPWLKRMHQEIKEIKERHSDIDPYGATNEAEFFSVVSEYFFSKPQHFEKKHPELFALLEKMYRQDLTT